MSLDVSSLLCSPSYLIALGNYTTCSVGAFYVVSRGLCCKDQAFASASSCFQNVSLAFVPELQSGFPQPWNAVWPYALLVFTLTLGAIWVTGTLLLRLAPLRGVWFKLHRFVLLVDYAFAKKHWNDNQKVEIKRKTELGGTLSITAFILIIGLCLRMLAIWVTSKDQPIQTVRTSSMEVQRGSDVHDFRNDLALNITAIGNMTCAQLDPAAQRVSTGLNSLERTELTAVSGLRVSCVDTPEGYPQIQFSCPSCQLVDDNYYFAFAFRDIPQQNKLAAAAGYIVGANATDALGLQSSLAQGPVFAGKGAPPYAPMTLRGPLNNATYISIRLIPRSLASKQDVQLMQVALHEYLDGAGIVQQDAGGNQTQQALYDQAAYLQFLTSARNASEGVALVVHIEVESAYVLQTTFIPGVGIISFISVVGGLYQLGVLIFFLTLASSERFIKYLRYDDKLSNRLEKQRLARYHWQKLRLAVKYGFLHHALTENKFEDDSNNSNNKSNNNKNSTDPNGSGGAQAGAGAGAGAGSKGRSSSSWASLAGLSLPPKGGPDHPNGASQGTGAAPGAGAHTHVALDVDSAGTATGAAAAVATGAGAGAGAGDSAGAPAAAAGAAAGAGVRSRSEAKTGEGLEGEEDGTKGVFGWLRRCKTKAQQERRVVREALNAADFPVSASMERKVAQEISQDYPSIRLPPERADPEEVAAQSEGFKAAVVGAGITTAYAVASGLDTVRKAVNKGSQALERSSSMVREAVHTLERRRAAEAMQSMRDNQDSAREQVHVPPLGLGEGASPSLSAAPSLSFSLRQGGPGAGAGLGTEAGTDAGPGAGVGAEAGVGVSGRGETAEGGGAVGGVGELEGSGLEEGSGRPSGRGSGRSGESLALAHSASVTALARRRKKMSHEDDRLGSSSTHEGSYVTHIRPPSWFRSYEMLPEPPSIKALEHKRRLEQRRRAAQKQFRHHGRTKEALSAPLLSAVSEETGEAARKHAHTHGHALVRSDYNDSEEGDPMSGELLGVGMGMPPFKEEGGEGEGEGEGGERGGHAEEEEQEVRHDELYSHLMDLYEYQRRFRTDFMMAESMLENIVQRFRPHSDL